MEHLPRQLVVQLGQSVDPDLVRETLRIEHDCCSFFELDFDSERRVLTVGVTSEDNVPALDAIAYALHTEATTSTY
jgi:hypothetical protein